MHLLAKSGGEELGQALLSELMLFNPAVEFSAKSIAMESRRDGGVALASRATRYLEIQALYDQWFDFHQQQTGLSTGKGSGWSRC